MLTFTLDTNCLIAVSERRDDAVYVRALADAHSRGEADVAVIGISASEKQRDGCRMEDFGEFRKRLKSMGLEHLPVVFPLAYFDITFWDVSLLADDEMEQLERKIHQIMFPSVEFLWADFSKTNRLDPNNPPHGTKWANCKCDVQALWSHMHHKREVFVTADSDFHKASVKPALIALGAGRIEYPRDAASLIHG